MFFQGYSAEPDAIDLFVEKGWVADDIHYESASRTLDYSSLAAKYLTIFNSVTGFMEALSASGAWAGPNNGWTEGNKWAYTFDVVTMIIPTSYPIIFPTYIPSLELHQNVNNSLGVILSKFFTSVHLFNPLDDKDFDFEGNELSDSDYNSPSKDFTSEIPQTDIGLAWSIFRTRGSPNKTNWPEHKVDTKTRISPETMLPTPVNLINRSLV
ncbi:uncharacterized protein HD556DRAFT_1309618 [Suillus plorans]|uniref:Glycosyl hydrolase family 92 domain-containing protein n=1 Tax=Suillus plorans TaxID=116603 RepID=A0A9P7ALS2_9AGAM|nr:uncharacterized protein HD556DRAFT_1309618 [Suillus plorans]KAG1792075.1 hypothetical protein HD556DRAFT_1309618 [Suillus plorans]